jgi:hypothetical protein
MQRSAGIGRRSSASARSGRQQRGASVSRRSSASAMSTHLKIVVENKKSSARLRHFPTDLSTPPCAPGLAEKVGREKKQGSRAREKETQMRNRLCFQRRPHSKHVPNLTAGGPAQPQHLRLRVVWLQKRGREGGEIA